MTIQPTTAQLAIFTSAPGFDRAIALLRELGRKRLARFAAAGTLPNCPMCGTLTTSHPDEWMVGICWCPMCEESVGFAAPEVARG